MNSETKTRFFKVCTVANFGVCVICYAAYKSREKVWWIFSWVENFILFVWIKLHRLLFEASIRLRSWVKEYTQTCCWLFVRAVMAYIGIVSGAAYATLSFDSLSFSTLSRIPFLFVEMYEYSRLDNTTAFFSSVVAWLCWCDCCCWSRKHVSRIKAFRVLSSNKSHVTSNSEVRLCVRVYAVANTLSHTSNGWHSLAVGKDYAVNEYTQ